MANKANANVKMVLAVFILLSFSRYNIVAVITYTTTVPTVTYTRNRANTASGV